MFLNFFRFFAPRVSIILFSYLEWPGRSIRPQNEKLSERKKINFVVQNLNLKKNLPFILYKLTFFASRHFIPFWKILENRNCPILGASLRIQPIKLGPAQAAVQNISTLALALLHIQITLALILSVRQTYWTQIDLLTGGWKISRH